MTAASSVPYSRSVSLTAGPVPAILGAMFLAAVALLARGPQFGNPVIQVDEQFYLLVGDRMLHGVLPYVDVWDRKPIGLFLIYAAIRLLGGGGILEYQAVATLFVIATAFTLARIASRVVRWPIAVAAGAVYILYLGIFGGDGGQSPIFYNLPVALAALAVLRIVERPGFGRRGVALGALAMALAGIAIQIKYTAVFEGIYFGLVLLWRAWRAGTRPVPLAAAALLWVGIALAPTVAAFAWYADHGYAAAFAYANFGSILGRNTNAFESPWVRLLRMTAFLLPLLVALALAWYAARQSADREPAGAYAFLRGWAIAAIVGVLIFGTYFDHYALPLLAPLAVTAAPALRGRDVAIGVRAVGRTWMIPMLVFVPLFGAVTSMLIIQKNVRSRGDGTEVARFVAVIRPRLHDCLFVYSGEPILYYLTGSCFPTRWAFPDHLNNISEDRSIGVDPLAETRRIMAGRPALVVSQDMPEKKMNWRTWGFMQAELARAYRPILTIQIGKGSRILYERRPGY